MLHSWTQWIDGCSLLLQRYVRKGNHAEDPAILIPVKCSAHIVGKKFAIEWKIALPEIRLILENNSLKFH